MSSLVMLFQWNLSKEQTVINLSAMLLLKVCFKAAMGSSQAPFTSLLMPFTGSTDPRPQLCFFVVSKGQQKAVCEMGQLTYTAAIHQ